ncbi:MAG: helix-turn-helix domain-containing protein [Mollicutes bacterium]|nr:helix-turn-helix domain-containing protein [Mollicutes bacterium]
MIVEDFSDRLKKAMSDKQMKQVDLCNKTGIDKALISNYLSGKYKAKQDKLHKLAIALDVSEGWLMGYDVDMDREWFEEKEPSEISIDNARYIETTTKTIKIPVLGKVPAGVPIEAIQDILGYEEIPASMLKSGNNYFALKIDGDSMYPDYKTGDIIIIRQQSDCNSGDDCVVMVNGDDATFKRVIKQEKSIILKPLNNNYEPYYFDEYEILTKPVKIIGIAIEVRRKLR